MSRMLVPENQGFVSNTLCLAEYFLLSLWYSDDCRDYEVQVFKEIANRTVSTCYSASGGVDGTVGADIPLKGAAFEDCSTFERPTNSSFRWILEVVSVEP